MLHTTVIRGLLREQGQCLIELAVPSLRKMRTAFLQPLQTFQLEHTLSYIFPEVRLPTVLRQLLRARVRQFRAVSGRLRSQCSFPPPVHPELPLGQPVPSQAAVRTCPGR